MLCFSARPLHRPDSRLASAEAPDKGGEHGHSIEGVGEWIGLLDLGGAQRDKAPPDAVALAQVLGLGVRAHSVRGAAWLGAECKKPSRVRRLLVF